MTRRIAPMLLALVTLTGATACNGSGSGTAEGTTTTTASPRTTDTTAVATDSTTTPPPGDEKEAVKAAYLRFWMVVDEYGKRTGRFDAVDAKTVLARVAIDGEYDHLFNTFQLNRLKGLVYRDGDAPDEFAPVVTIEGPGRASVRDCRTDRGGVFKEATGERVDTPTDGRRLFEVVLVKDGAEWKVSSVGGRTNPEDPPCTA